MSEKKINEIKKDKTATNMARSLRDRVAAGEVPLEQLQAILDQIDALEERAKVLRRIRNMLAKNCFRRSRQMALAVGIEWELTYEQVERFACAPCAVCGNVASLFEPKLVIMRKDRTKGYTIDNVQPGCVRCSYEGRNRALVVKAKAKAGSK